MKKSLFTTILLFIQLSIMASDGIENNPKNNFLQNEIKSGYVDIGKCKLYYDECGQGTPLIMIHGGFLDKRMWDDQFLEFSKLFRVIKYDVRKYGLSKSEPDTFSHHEDLKVFMDKLGIEKAVIMGLSMGGYISIDFTLTHPEKVLALIPVSSGLTGYDIIDKPTTELQMKWKNVKTIEEGVEILQEYLVYGPYRKPEQVNPEVRKKIKQMFTDNILNDMNPAFKQIRTDPPAIKRLSEIKIPTLTIYGDMDVPGIIEIAEKIVKDVKGSNKYIVKNAAHNVNMEKPDEFNAVVIKFIKSLEK